MKKIKLRDNGSYTHIKAASGKNIKANMLEIGRTYLHTGAKDEEVFNKSL